MTTDQFKQVCHCGHDIDTHFEKKGACLGMRCEPECLRYRDSLRSLKPAPKSGVRVLGSADDDDTLSWMDSWLDRGLNYP